MRTPMEMDGAVGVHIVPFPLDDRADHPGVVTFLDDEERARRAAIAGPLQRTRFEAAHGVTRLVLGHHLGVAPETIVFTRAPGGKPRVFGAPHLQFNLSHSAGHAILALTDGRPVGVDIEQVRPIDVPGIAGRIFPRNDAEALVRLSGQRQLQRFFRCWTRMESLAKATGVGLAGPLAALGAGDDAPLFSSVFCELSDQTGSRWSVADISAPPGFAAAVAVAGSQLQLLRGGVPPV